jgi:NAD(P)-dependent dehydrogenase (short-subunit alcohol dehydrogenase family)
MPGTLNGKVALVTGGASGIGRATALTFAREGAKLIIADVDVDGGQQTVHMIKEYGGDTTFVQVDVTQASDVEAMIATAVETYGRLDCAHNNAGVGGDGMTITDCTEEDWHRIISINLTGVWLCMKYEIPEMLKHGSGAIVNTASIMGLVATGTSPAYMASKHGVVGLTKSAALAYAQSGIRVNAVCPGFIRTPMVEGSPRYNEEREAELIGRHPIGRLGQPDEVAETVVWLCSDAASFVTGHTMTVDGGYVAQ